MRLDKHYVSRGRLAVGVCCLQSGSQFSNMTGLTKKKLVIEKFKTWRRYFKNINDLPVSRP